MGIFLVQLTCSRVVIPESSTNLSTGAHFALRGIISMRSSICSWTISGEDLDAFVGGAGRAYSRFWTLEERREEKGELTHLISLEELDSPSRFFCFGNIKQSAVFGTVWALLGLFQNSSFFSSCWPRKGHIGRTTRNSNPAMMLSAGGAKGCSDHCFCAPPDHTAQLLTLHQQRADNQYRTAIQI